MMKVAAYPTYDSYRDSGVKWIGEVPEGWNVKRLKHLVRQVSDKVSSKESPLRYIGMENVESWSGHLIDGNAEVEGLAAKFAPNDVIFGKLRPYLAKTTKLHFTGICSTEFIVFRARGGIEPDFLAYLLRSPDFVSYIDSSTYGSKMPRANPNFIANCSIVAPSFPEQRAIAAFLDDKCAKIDEAVRIKEAQIVLLRERRQILIQEAVTRGLNPDAPIKDSGIDWIGQIPAHWEVTKLKYAADIFRGKFTHRPRNDPQLYDGAYPFFQTGDVARAGMFLSEFKQTLNEKGLRVSTLIPKGTILITIAANIGDVAILGIDGCFPDSVVGFKPKTMVERDFLYYSMSSMKRIFLDSSIANAQANLNVDRIGAIAFCIPPRNEQATIINYIAIANRKISDGITIKQAQITALKEYKTCLINAAVT